MSYSTKYVAALFCTLPFFAQNANAKEKKKSYEKSVFSNYQSLPANTPAIEKTKAKAADAFPGWTATTDKVNGSITDLYGKSITLAGTTNKDKAAGYIAQRLKDFGFKPG